MSDAVPVVCGPTAAGKSALALRLAASVGAAILSADSRQLYRGFDVGTAKPTADELARVPHYGIDVADPRERWSAARWADDCERWMAASRARGLAPLVVGGTGFYLRALAEPLFAEPPLDPVGRRALEHALAPLATDELRRWVATLDPARAHLQRTQLLRAVEVALLTGERLSAWHARTARPPRHRLRYLVVDPGPVLAERIARRVDAMLAGGWVEEVERLVLELPPDAPAWNASGYGAVRDAVAGRCTLAAARDRIVIETRQYAKRQRTWFRNQVPAASVTLLDPDAPDAAARALAWWRDADAAARPFDGAPAPAPDRSDVSDAEDAP